MPRKEVCVVGGESLVQPYVTPILAGHQVTKPLVSQFMGNQPLAAPNIFRLFVKERRRV